MHSHSNKLLAQCAGGVLSASDTNLCIQQVTNLYLTDYLGSITWNWRTVGESAWSIIPGKIGDTIDLSITGIIDREVRAFVSGSGCSDTSNIITIHSSEYGEKPLVWDATSTCGNKITNLYADPTTNPSYWKQIDGPGNSTFFQDSTDNSPDSVVVDTPGQYVFGWHITDGICTKQANDTVIFYEQNIANAGEDIFHCLVNIGETFNLNAIPSLPGTTGSWSGSGITISEPTNPNSPVQGNPSSTAYTLTWTEVNGDCIDNDIVEVNILRQPDANAGVDEQKCSLTDTLNASPSAEYFGNWTLLSGPDTVSYNSTNNYNAIITANNYGENFVFEWTLTNSFCADTDTVVIDFYEQPVANPVWPSDECGLSTTLGAFPSTSSSSVTRIWEYVNGSGPQNIGQPTSLSDTSASVQIPEGAYGNYSFRWKERNGTCADSLDVNMTFYEIPVPNAGTDIDSCGSELELNATKSISGSNFRWNVLNSPNTITFIGDTSTNSLISTSVYGTYALVFEEVNAICSASDTMQATFIQIPEANAGPGGDTCGLTYTLKALPSIQNSSSQWWLISNNNSTAISTKPTFEATVDTPGQYVYLWKETNLKCSSEDTVLIQYHEQPSAHVLSSEDACGITQNILTQINEGTVNTWTFISGPGAARFSDQKADGSFDVVVSATGKYNFNLNTATTYCSADTAISLEFFDEVTAYAGEDTLVCGDSILLTAQQDIGAGQWNLPDKSVIFTNDTAFNTYAKAEVFGKYNIVWTVANGTCLEKDTILVDFLKPPNASAGASDTICSYNYFLSASPENGFWTLLNPDEIQISDALDANAEIQVSRNGVYRLFWTANNNSCTDTAMVTLSFAAIPEANAGPDQELDNIFTTQMEAIDPGNGFSGVWNLVSGSGTPLDNTSPNTNIRNLALGKNSFTWTISNELCSSSDSVSIFVYDIFIPEVITPNGDGQNDIFYIKGIEKISPVEVTIMNRWGIEVFYSEDYQNDWDGTNKNGNLLTNDTYFFVISIPGAGVRKGFVILKI